MAYELANKVTMVFRMKNNNMIFFTVRKKAHIIEVKLNFQNG